MFRLDRKELAELRRHRGAVKDAAAAVDDEFLAMMRMLRARAAPVNDAVRRFNDAARAARAYVEQTGEGFRDAFNERTERWQESDAGQAALAFVEAWEEAADALDDALDTVALLEPDKPETDAYTQALAGLPEEEN